MIAKITRVLNAYKKLGIAGVLVAVLLTIVLNSTASAISSSLLPHISPNLSPAVSIPYQPTQIQTSKVETVATPAKVVLTSLAAQACVPEPEPSLSTLSSYKLSPGVHAVIEPIRYYQVYGQTPVQIQAQLLQCGPVFDGQRWAGDTVYNLSWYFDYDFSADKTQCSLKDIAILAHAQVILPAWQNTGASNELGSRWNHTASALAVHENGHVQLLQTTAQTIYNELQAMPQLACNNIGQQATAAIQKDLDELRADNDGYDVATNHGVNQGARL